MCIMWGMVKRITGRVGHKLGMHPGRNANPQQGEMHINTQSYSVSNLETSVSSAAYLWTGEGKCIS